MPERTKGLWRLLPRRERRFVLHQQNFEFLKRGPGDTDRRLRRWFHSAAGLLPGATAHSARIRHDPATSTYGHRSWSAFSVACRAAPLRIRGVKHGGVGHSFTRRIRARSTNLPLTGPLSRSAITKPYFTDKSVPDIQRPECAEELEAGNFCTLRLTFTRGVPLLHTGPLSIDG